jgi:hypothetical protein
VSGCAVTPDGKRVVSASLDGTLKVWELESGREMVTLRGHAAVVSDCAVTADGKRVVSASRDSTLKVWDIDSGRCVHTVHGASEFRCVTSTSEGICAGDELGNVWILERESAVPTKVAPAMSSARGLVYISYDRKDCKWLERLEKHLAPLRREGIEVWNDTRIQAGQNRKKAIEDALAQAKVAVLLVSADFLASDSYQHELLPLLRAAKKDELRLLWVPIGHSQFESAGLGGYPAVCEPSKPLLRPSDARTDKVLKKVGTEIMKALKSK